MKSKVLIIGPIEDFGGRELEAGYISSVLKSEFDVKVVSTANFTKKSQFFEVSEGIQMTSIKQMLYKRYWVLRPATYLSYYRNGRKKPLYFYLNNKINKRILNYLENRLLNKIIKNCDLVFIIAHLTTQRLKKIITFSQRQRKPIVFRTTGEIPQQKFPSYFTKVNHFIHHSEQNARFLENISGENWSVIDQTAFEEDKLLGFSCTKKSPTRFGVIGRLSPEKNLQNLLLFFKEFADPDDRLYLLGEGELRVKLEKLRGNNSKIRILGAIASPDIPEFFENIDCLILASLTEAGPLVGIEAMAAGRLILSTRVGAMPERLKGTLNDFWFDAHEKDSFGKQYNRLKSLTSSDAYEITRKNRQVYLKEYSKTKVADKYLKLVRQFVDK